MGPFLYSKKIELRLDFIKLKDRSKSNYFNQLTDETHYETRSVDIHYKFFFNFSCF